MSLLSHNELLELIDAGVIQNAKKEAVNAASIDIHLGDIVIVECQPHPRDYVVDYSKREKYTSSQYFCKNMEYILHPGDFILTQSVEVFNLPNNISAEYKLKSSMARIGLDHCLAGWCDAGWNGSVLTMELKNVLKHHAIQIRSGDAIGQMIFFRHSPVPDDASYASKGRYNGDKTVKAIKA